MRGEEELGKFLNLKFIIMNYAFLIMHYELYINKLCIMNYALTQFFREVSASRA